MSPVATMVSYYVHGRAGWLITVALLSLAGGSAALLLRAHAHGDRRGVRLLGVWAVAVLAGALFPIDPYGRWDRPPSLAGMVHGTAAMIAFAALPAAAVLLTRGWRRDARWRPVSRALTVAAALTVGTFLVTMVALVDVLGGPSLPGNLVGLAERLMLWSYVAWLAIAAVGMRGLVRAGARDPVNEK